MSRHINNSVLSFLWVIFFGCALAQLSNTFPGNNKMEETQAKRFKFWLNKDNNVHIPVDFKPDPISAQHSLNATQVILVVGTGSFMPRYAKMFMGGLRKV